MQITHRSLNSTQIGFIKPAANIEVKRREGYSIINTADSSDDHELETVPLQPGEQLRIILRH
jgi:hypothetical protein